MKTIHKYPLTLEARQSVMMPYGAKIVRAEFQGTNLSLWALVDTREPKVNRKLFMQNTGKPIPQKDNKAFRYIYSVQQEDATMLHIFEIVSLTN